MLALQFIRDNLRFLSAGVLLMLTSSYGQTFFISIFAAQIMADFALSDGQWGLVYTIGTTASAALMFWAGALTDRFRVRFLAWMVLPGLALSCFAMAMNTHVFGLVLCILCLRFFGQGMTYQLASVAMARWFVARRGLALSISSLGFSFGQAVLPVIFATLLLQFEWRVLWGASGVGAFLVLPVLLALLTQERTPQSLAKTEDSVGMNARHWSRKEVLKSRLFWMLLPLLLGPPAWGTSLFFQQVHIATVKDWPLVSYLSLIPLMTAIAVTVTLISGHLIDRFGTARLMQFYLIPFLLGFAILSVAPSLGWAALAFLFFGIATGLQTTIITAFWAEFFGTRHIGAIKASSTSIMVLGSAIGPGITGLLIDVGLTFPQQMIGIVIYFALSLALVWVAIEGARKDLPQRKQDQTPR